MGKNLLFILSVLLSINSFSQISFEKGYYIDNSDNKVDCLIKNVDWKSNPTEFEYKLSNDSEKKSLNIKSVKEFGIYNESKYIKAKVNIERSSNANSTNYLNENKEPVFNEEELFLKVLIEGKANLYHYSAGEISKYFYNTNDSPIEQLIYIKYKTLENNIAANQYYKQQLWLNLKCEGISMNDVNNINFKRNDLINFFIKYNECNQYEFINYHAKQKREFFSLSLRPRIINSSLSVKNSMAPHRNTDFGNETDFGLGLEAEFTLPFNKNKWSLFIEPTYYVSTFENVSDNDFIPYLPDGKVYGKSDFKSLQLPIGIRHYFFLNDNSKIFVNFGLMFNFSLKSTIEFDAVNNSYHLNTLGMDGSYTRVYGAGYKFNNKYSLEFRFHEAMDVLGSYNSWSSEYKSMSLILGYTLF